MKPKFSVTYPDGTQPTAVPQRAAHIQEAIVTLPDKIPSKPQPKVTTLPLYGIRITDEADKVTVTSCLHATNPHKYYEECDELNGDWYEHDHKMDMLESLIEAHYRANVKVTSKGYLKGIEDVMDDLKKMCSSLQDAIDNPKKKGR